MKKISIILVGILLFGCQSTMEVRDSVLVPAPVVSSEKMADAIKNVPPKYPINAVKSRKNGWVHLAYSIDENGRAKDIEIIDSSEPNTFDKVSIESLKKWQFESATESKKFETVIQYKINQ